MDWLFALLFGTVLSQCAFAFKHIGLAFSSIFGYRLYNETRSNKCSTVLQKFNGNFTISKNDEKSGVIYGFHRLNADCNTTIPWFKRFYVGITTDVQHQGNEISIFCHNTLYQKLITNINIDSPTTQGTKAIEYSTYITVTSTSWGAYLDKKSVDFKLKPNNLQEKIISDILEIYEENQIAVVCIAGQSGSRKSTIADLLASKLKTCICTQYNPTRPGHTLNNVHTTANTSKEKPLIMEWCEIDTSIKNISKGIPRIAKGSQLETYDKADFNGLLDKICNRKIFPYLIIIMTMNSPFEEIDKIDPSYLREGRIHKRFVMNVKVD
jgi:hypothetical protein